jgi:hypothetical protein
VQGTSGVHDFFLLLLQKILEVRDSLLEEALYFLFRCLDRILAGCQLVGLQLLDAIASNLPEFLFVVLRIGFQLLHGLEFKFLGVASHLCAREHFPCLLDLEVQVTCLEHLLDLINYALIEHTKRKDII